MPRPSLLCHPRVGQQAGAVSLPLPSPRPVPATAPALAARWATGVVPGAGPADGDWGRVQASFPGRRGYLDTATMGLPPTSALRALASAHRAWRDGSGSPQDWDLPVGRSRELFAQLLGVPATWVSVGSQTSAMVGLVAASVPPGARVVLAAGDFTSVMWPFLSQVDRGVRVDVVPLGAVADAVDEGTAWVALSAVQSADGRLADLEAVRQGCRRHGARLLVDATQAAGWLPLQGADFDVVVVSGYKWLLSPRGTCLTSMRPETVGLLTPSAAGWYAGCEVWSSLYDAPLRLATGARRFDVSPAWFSWVGAHPAMQLIASVGVEAIHARVQHLAAAFRARLDLPETGSAITSVPCDASAQRRLAASGIRAALRRGQLRVAFHLYNDEADVARVAEALQPGGGRASAG